MKSAREIHQEDVDLIYVGERLRHLDESRVAALAQSMKDIGLMTPISLRIAEKVLIDGEEVVDVPALVAGATRLAAAKALAWKKIDVIYVSGNDVDAQLWEIDENLARAELTIEQKREHLKRRKELWEARQKEIRVGNKCPPEIGYKKPPAAEKGFAAETAAATGLSKRRINQLLSDEKPRPVPKPITVKTGFDASEDRIKRAQNAYLSLSDEERRAFKEWLDSPVFDETEAA